MSWIDWCIVIIPMGLLIWLAIYSGKFARGAWISSRLGESPDVMCCASESLLPRFLLYHLLPDANRITKPGMLSASGERSLRLYGLSLL